MKPVKCGLYSACGWLISRMLRYYPPPQCLSGDDIRKQGSNVSVSYQIVPGWPTITGFTRILGCIGHPSWTSPGNRYGQVVHGQTCTFVMCPISMGCHRTQKENTLVDALGLSEAIGQAAADKRTPRSNGARWN